jgi:RimJ/RimL family protein N-acetyltransferase
MTRPTLETDRLLLRPFAMADALNVQLMAGEDAIADTLVTIPHPYDLRDAEEFIEGHEAAWEARQALELAIERRDGAILVGAIHLALELSEERADLGYWIGPSHWGNGYATEAAQALVRFGFEELGLHRIHAHSLTRNAASIRVLEHVGMTREGVRREHVKHRGRFEDIVDYAILREEA